MLGGPDAVSIKSGPGHDTLKLYFSIRWDLWVKLLISVRPWRETLMHYFSISGGLGAVSTKSVS
jgi:hypothetical protein